MFTILDIYHLFWQLTKIYTVSTKQSVGIWWIFTKQIIAIQVQCYKAYEVAWDRQIHRYTSIYGSIIISNQLIMFADNLNLDLMWFCVNPFCLSRTHARTAKMTSLLVLSNSCTQNWSVGNSHLNWITINMNWHVFSNNLSSLCCNRC